MTAPDTNTSGECDIPTLVAAADAARKNGTTLRAEVRAAVDAARNNDNDEWEWGVRSKYTGEFVCYGDETTAREVAAGSHSPLVRRRVGPVEEVNHDAWPTRRHRGTRRRGNT